MNNIRYGRSRTAKPEIRRAGSGSELCALCGRNGDLQTSHIIPKFVGKWFKDTSATGAMLDILPRQRARFDYQKNAASDYVKIVQDLPAYKMLCGKCEQRFSKLEKQFAENIFYPFNNHGAKQLEYGDWLEPFAISLAWRVLKSGHERFKSRYPDFITDVKRAEAAWRESLLGDAWTAPHYESNILFLDDVIGTGAASEKFDWYMRRSIECGIDCWFGRIFTYAKLPSMVLVTAILPDVLTGWHETRIGERGVLASRHRVRVGCMFWEYLLTRDFSDGGWLDAPVPRVPLEKLVKRQQRAFQKDPKKFLESDTTKIAVAHMVSRYRQRAACMPSSVIGLIDNIGNQVAGTKAETVLNISKSEKVLDAISSLSAKETASLDSGIREAINKMRVTGYSVEYRLNTNTISITFIANHNSTKADQHAVIETERAKIEAKRSNNDTPIAIFSWNYEDGSFESGFMVPPDRSR